VCVCVCVRERECLRDCVNQCSWFWVTCVCLSGLSHKLNSGVCVCLLKRCGSPLSCCSSNDLPLSLTKTLLSPTIMTLTHSSCDGRPSLHLRYVTALSHRDATRQTRLLLRTHIHGSPQKTKYRVTTVDAWIEMLRYNKLLLWKSHQLSPTRDGRAVCVCVCVSVCVCVCVCGHESPFSQAA